MTKTHFILFTHNLVVDGLERAAIYDLQHEKIHIIPSVLRDILNDLRNAPLTEVQERYAPEQPEVFDKYIQFLIHKDLGFFTDEPERFPLLDLSWESPCILQNAIVEYHFAAYDGVSLLTQLDALLCRHIELRLDADEYSLAAIMHLLEASEGKIFRSLHLVFRYSPQLTDEFLGALYEKFQKIQDIIVYQAPWAHSHPQHSAHIRYLEEDFRHTYFRAPFSHQKYILNIPYVAEALSHNCYYNQKVCIDRNGDVKNCLNHDRVFGNLNDSPLADFISTSAFQELWHVNTDKIEEFRHSEFRYCTFVSNPLKKTGADTYSLVTYE